MAFNNMYHIIDRDDWHAYRNEITSDINVKLTEKQLEALLAFNDHLTLEDANDIYQPLTQLISIYFKNYQRLISERNQFLGINDKIPPFIIGISGSVAVGKSTTARLLQLFLSQFFPYLDVELITTDGFLYPNEQLEHWDLMHRKGFPESYDMHELKKFFMAVKSNKQRLKVPLYSHESYDRINAYREIKSPHILIVEGINVLQFVGSDQFFIGEYADLSIYVDADTELIEKWYMERFILLRENALKDPDHYNQRYSKMSLDDALRSAKRTWENINLVNLEDYILPTRDRADIVIHKIENHYIDSIRMRRY
ncbi:MULTISPECIES: type I pantothenate kinase [Aerococcus]|uniref:type I pantothenate kinase n=1 Tax=Aerococcus TaxID=1375 RepID=UPI0018A7837C|nr:MULTISPECIES: type I pantothenate kinase [Aerococcus]MCY3035739.1 type I pantothenate kinase [Aerococcus sp. Group 2]MCY3039873.1 type I pantothenate kinase [Aerococcus sp. Group 2]MCY3040407.1 type I pantothenate kinase [Aerococcus sp. Group 2]MCY3043331.1 type I pantothenate kinase [Aerococcus sp. Group 2]MDK6519851.1 type I pantothenate kinase [Aerococcus urinae]